MALGTSPGCVLRARVMGAITTRCGNTRPARTVGVNSSECLLIEDLLGKDLCGGRDSSARSSRPMGQPGTPEAGQARARAARRSVPHQSSGSVDKHTLEFVALHVKPSRKHPAYLENILNRNVLSEKTWKGRE